ncbi:MAG: TIGR00282 family metallophosphoesterase [Desulfohalobiaceae bacterium]|nr:TIGR00282 family metallophosphoesterase [Desulfohalobiaceae bacterium]
MRILFLGDIVGRPGRKAVCNRLPQLRREYELDLVMANAENASGGLGLNQKNARQLHRAGLEVLTSGNHIWRYKEILPFLEETDWLLRPANYPPRVPGRGYTVLESGETRVAVLNLQGRVFMEPLDCPFRAADTVLLQMQEQNPDVILVDFHAEATSEKQALRHYLEGRVTALLGTHTHVQTGDASVGDKGTAYVTDLGMCGPRDSVIGMDPDPVVQGFKMQTPQRWSVAGGKTVLDGVLLDIDSQSGRCEAITAWREEQEV